MLCTKTGHQLFPHTVRWRGWVEWRLISSVLLVSDSLAHLRSLCGFLYNTWAKYSNYNYRCCKFRRKFADDRVPRVIKILQILEKLSSNRLRFRPPQHTRKTCNKWGKLRETVFWLGITPKAFLVSFTQQTVVSAAWRRHWTKKTCCTCICVRQLWTQAVKQNRILWTGSFRVLAVRLRFISVDMSTQTLVLNSLHKTHVNPRSIMTLC